MNRSLRVGFVTLYRVLIGSLLILLLGGCSKFNVQKPILDGAFFTEGDSALNPPTDKLSENCFADVTVDACMFLKNPVAQEKGAVALRDLEAVRKFGVKIRGLTPTGFLENARVQVFALHAPRFTLENLSELKGPQAGGHRSLEQFSAYYWTNRLFDYLEARIGSERLPSFRLKVYVDDVFTGYSSANQSVHLDFKEGRLPKALSGEVVIHLAAQAIAHGLSEGKLFAKDLTQHNTCALDPKGCCTTGDGCAQALGNGFGEYVAAMMFPDSARIGESVANSVKGQELCSMVRDLTMLSARTKDQVYSACQPAGRAVVMGAWYASVWWKLRAQIEAQEPGAGADVDKLFFDHAKAWTSLSTFTSAKAEALRLAGMYNGGKFAAAFAAAFAVF
ncbi:MAG: hypothetical protein HC883_06240 [Bdellovibrionaceae bacterium]|nr:hypothetical protein [Pseudobdellovibrionaceae bacterium]